MIKNLKFIPLITVGISIGFVSCKQDTKEAIKEATKELEAEEEAKAAKIRKQIADAQAEGKKEKRNFKMKRFLDEQNKIRKRKGQELWTEIPRDVQIKEGFLVEMDGKYFEDVGYGP